MSIMEARGKLSVSSILEKPDVPTVVYGKYKVRAHLKPTGQTYVEVFQPGVGNLAEHAGRVSVGPSTGNEDSVKVAERMIELAARNQPTNRMELLALRELVQRGSHG